MSRARLLLVLLFVLALAGACALTLWLFYDPPFLTWQHGAELAEPLNRYAAARLPGQMIHIQRVREYTDSCSVVRAATPSGSVFYAVLYKIADVWQVVYTGGQGGLDPVLSWGQICGQPGPLLLDIERPPLE